MTIPERCPHCDSIGTMTLRWMLIGKDRLRRQVLRCTCCNTGAVLKP